MNRFEYLNNITKYDKTILDVGCGKNSPCQYIYNKNIIGMDGYLPYIKESKKKGFHDDYILCDFNYLPIKKKISGCNYIS